MEIDVARKAASEVLEKSLRRQESLQVWWVGGAQERECTARVGSWCSCLVYTLVAGTIGRHNCSLMGQTSQEYLHNQGLDCAIPMGHLAHETTTIVICLSD